jgi:hypothetical protein
MRSRRALLSSDEQTRETRRPDNDDDDTKSDLQVAQSIELPDRLQIILNCQ